jgi:rhodanese-related sulfurtransferase
MQIKHKEVMKRMIKKTPKTKKTGELLTSINLGKKYAGRYILYYGAKKISKKGCSKKLPLVNKAYNDKNRGVTRLDSNGIGHIYMNCPSSYRSVKRHVHYVLSKKSGDGWLPKQYEKEIVCNVDKSFVKNAIKNRCYLIINALPIDEYIKNRIPESISLPYNSNKNNAAIIKYIKDMGKKLPKLNEYANSRNILNIPIIVYCYSSKCNAGHKLIEILMKIGFTNILEYKEGITGWLKN